MANALALSPEQIEAAHEGDVGCHLHRGLVMPEGLCCACENEDPCAVWLDAARQWIDEQEWINDHEAPVCTACGDRPIGCSRCADEDGTR